MHKTVAPAIHYWGTPVVLVSTRNPDDSTNVAPMSSAWWLGWSCMLGFDASSQTVQNLARERECVLNLASASCAAAVDALALTTGRRDVPVHKRLLGYRHQRDKLGLAGLSEQPSRELRAPRIAECPVQLEARVVAIRPLGKGDPRMTVPACSVEVQIVAAHVEEALLAGEDRIDPHKWRPLLMSFRELFTLGEQVGRSRLARGDEALYAPWKGGVFTRMAARALGMAAHYRHGVEDEHEAEQSG